MRQMDLKIISFPPLYNDNLLKVIFKLVFETDTIYIQRYNVKHNPEEREQA